MKNETINRSLNAAGIDEQGAGTEHLSKIVVEDELEASETDDDVSSADYVSVPDETEQWSSYLASTVGTRPSLEDSISPDFGDRQRGKDQEMDLMFKMNDMYRLLDLISEQGSGGLGKFCCRILIGCVHWSLP